MANLKVQNAISNLQQYVTDDVGNQSSLSVSTLGTSVGTLASRGQFTLWGDSSSPTFTNNNRNIYCAGRGANGSGDVEGINIQTGYGFNTYALIGTAQGYQSMGSSIAATLTAKESSKNTGLLVTAEGVSTVSQQAYGAQLFSRNARDNSGVRAFGHGYNFTGSALGGLFQGQKAKENTGVDALAYGGYVGISSVGGRFTAYGSVRNIGIFSYAPAVNGSFSAYLSGHTYISDSLGIGTTTPGGDMLDVRGRCYSQVGWHMSNADYGEYFESADGKEIPLGTVVALDENGKIQEARKNDTPIGVVTQSSAVAANSYKEWPHKYEKDKYGNIVYEEVEEEETEPKMKTTPQEVPRYDEKGNRDMETFEDSELEITDDGHPVMVGTGKKIKVKRKKLNPKYDGSKEYIPRCDRPEWNCVGLLGQLYVNKNQNTSKSWIKIKDTSDDVELWFVK